MFGNDWWLYPPPQHLKQLADIATADHPADNSDHQGEAVLFEGEEKQKILTKAQVDKALEVLKSKLKDLTEKAEKAKKEGEGEGKKEGEGEGGLVRRAVVGPAWRLKNNLSMTFDDWFLRATVQLGGAFAFKMFFKFKLCNHNLWTCSSIGTICPVVQMLFFTVHGVQYTLYLEISKSWAKSHHLQSWNKANLNKFGHSTFHHLRTYQRGSRNVLPLAGDWRCQNVFTVAQRETHVKSLDITCPHFDGEHKGRQGRTFADVESFANRSEWITR